MTTDTVPTVGFTLLAIIVPIVACEAWGIARGIRKSDRARDAIRDKVDRLARSFPMYPPPPPPRRETVGRLDIDAIVARAGLPKIGDAYPSAPGLVLTNWTLDPTPFHDRAKVVLTYAKAGEGAKTPRFEIVQTRTVETKCRHEANPPHATHCRWCGERRK